MVLIGMAIGAGLGLLGIYIAYQLWVVNPERPPRSVRAFGALHRVFVNKWYFDEAYDRAFVRPFALVRPLRATTFERVLVNGALVGGAPARARRSAAVRAVQTGYLRYYAALLLVGSPASAPTS
jgi:NADH-quinone oxidoreductase subunit L